MRKLRVDELSEKSQKTQLDVEERVIGVQLGWVNFARHSLWQWRLYEEVDLMHETFKLSSVPTQTKIHAFTSKNDPNKDTFYRERVKRLLSWCQTINVAVIGTTAFSLSSLCCCCTSLPSSAIIWREGEILSSRARDRIFVLLLSKTSPPQLQLVNFFSWKSGCGRGTNSKIL